MKLNVQKGKDNRYQERGITLIALVITIIVLLILAGVAINMAIDSNGLFGKANDAVEAWNTSVTNEKTELDSLIEKAESLGGDGIEKVEGSSSDWEVSGTTIVKYKGETVNIVDFKDIVIPNYVDGVAVDTIGEELFNGNSWATSLTISEGIVNIEAKAFYSCRNLTSIVIPNTVKTIGQEAFYQCMSVTGDLVIPDSVETIGNYAFHYCTGLTGNIIIGNGVKSIGNWAFKQCTNTGLTLGSSVETIGEEAFYYCQNLAGDITIPNSIKTIKYGAFQGCSSINSITIPSTVETVESNAFSSVKQIYYDGSLSTEYWGATKVND